jgi:tetratricopeptide (TPR) repeat protein
LKHNDDEAIRLLKDAINLSPKFAELHWFLARVYYHNDNHSEGMEQMQKAIEIDPKLLKAYLDLAYMYKAHEYYPEAIKLLKTAIEIAPTDPNPYSLLAEVYEDQGTNEDAGRYYEQAANRLNADDSFNKNIYLGRAARLRGRYDEAISYFQKLVNMEPRDKAYYEMGLTYIASGSRSAALEQYQQLVQLKSSLAEELLEKTKEMK